LNWFRGLFANFWDQVLLLVTALVLCGVSSFSLADDYKINPVWVFFAWNSLFYIAFLIRKFPNQWKSRGFLTFIMISSIFHGAIVISLMRFFSLAYWPIALFSEAVTGLQIANRLFGTVPGNSRN
jgi:FtsH-binding integral membrane protein